MAPDMAALVSLLEGSTQWRTVRWRHVEVAAWRQEPGAEECADMWAALDVAMYDAAANPADLDSPQHQQAPQGARVVEAVDRVLANWAQAVATFASSAEPASMPPKFPVSAAIAVSAWQRTWEGTPPAQRVEILTEYEDMRAAYELEQLRQLAYGNDAPKQNVIDARTRAARKRHREATDAIRTMIQLDVRMLATLEGSKQPDPWPGWFVRQAVTVVFGEPGGGKSSWLSYELHRLQQEGHGCLLLPSPAEDLPGHLGQRFAGSMVKGAWQDAEAWLGVTPEHLDTLQRYVIDQKVACVAIDSLAGFAGQSDQAVDWNDAGAVKNLFATLASWAVRTDCALVLVAHSRKSMEKKAGSWKDLSGSVQLAASARVVVMVDRADNGMVEVSREKSNLAEGLGQIEQFEQDGFTLRPAGFADRDKRHDAAKAKRAAAADRFQAAVDGWPARRAEFVDEQDADYVKKKRLRAYLTEHGCSGKEQQFADKHGWHPRVRKSKGNTIVMGWRFSKPAPQQELEGVPAEQQQDGGETPATPAAPGGDG